MNKFKMMSATLGILGSILAPSLRADESDKTTYMTTNQPLQIQGTLLSPGRYMLKVANPDSDRRIVEIFNADGTKLEGLIQALPAYRLELSDAQFVLADPQAGQPATLQYWFYPGDNSGLEFVTPKVASVNAQKPGRKGKSQPASQAADDAN
jgi:hypothetical protein